MTNPFRPVSISLNPNFSLTDVLFSLRLLVSPWRYFDVRTEAELAARLAAFLGRRHVILFESGRQSEYFLLSALGIGAGDKVVIQAFTCVAVPNSVLWTGATPVYADIDQSLNLDPARLEKLLDKNTRAVIVQHTLGTPANLEGIKAVCDRRKITLIEDCAHGLGGEVKGRKLGTFGTAAFFSFGRDKVISSVWGGAVATDDDHLAQRLRELSDRLPRRGYFWIAGQLYYPVLVEKILATYSFFNLGKAAHRLLHSLSLVSRVLTPEEKTGKKPAAFYRGLPGALAALALVQLDKLDNFIAHRRELAAFYASELGLGYDPDTTYLRFNIFVADPPGLRLFAARRHIFLGDWYDTVVAPKDVDLDAIGYRPGAAPKAEETAAHIVNLPTGPTVSRQEAGRVVAVVKEWK